MILHEEGGNDFQQSDAHDLMTILTLAYPDHPWAVRVGEGFIFVRYLHPLYEHLFKGPVGVVIKTRTSYSASEMKRQVINAGGELLERMGLGRGQSNGDEPLIIEGVPQKFHKKEAVIEKVECPTSLN